MPEFKPCVIIPVYNHARAIGTTVSNIRQQVALINIILVNDGSDAHCSDVLARLVQNDDHITLVELAENRGKGAAVKAGLLRAAQLGHSHGLQFDADGQHDTGDIPRFLESARQNPQAMIVGVPVFDQSVPGLRYFARYLTHFWVWINTLSFQIRDSMCGFRVYPVHATNELDKRTPIGNRMDYDIEVLVRWCWLNRKVIQLTTHVKYPSDGVSHFRGWQDNLLISTMHARLFFLMLIKSPVIVWRRFRRSHP
jgi:glycosyltransferase involved in cell wall biosynthesis